MLHHTLLKHQPTFYEKKSGLAFLTLFLWDYLVTGGGTVEVFDGHCCTVVKGFRRTEAVK